MKFASKKAIRHCVGMIIIPTDELADEFEVTFLKCSKKGVTAKRFTIPDDKNTVDDVPFDDIVARLPAPTVSGGTVRTKKMVVFSVHLSQYRPQ